MNVKKTSLEIIALLRSNFPVDIFSFATEECVHYGSDWTRVFIPNPIGICFPRTTLEVSQILKFCNEHEISIVPSGGRTGLAGGAVAHSGELVLSLERMNKVYEPSIEAESIRVESGVITEAVSRACEKHGLHWPISMASQGSSQIGGNLATNAGGVHVVHYGMTRDWVLGIKVVLMDGSILDINGELEKNNTGLDLKNLFIGSEGTLGIITEAHLKLCKIPAQKMTYFFSLVNLDAIKKLFLKCRSTEKSIFTFEVISQNSLSCVEKTFNIQNPIAKKTFAYALVEFVSDSHLSIAQELDNWAVSLSEDGTVDNCFAPQSSAERLLIWKLREGITESLQNESVVHKNDVSVPVKHLSSFLNDCIEHCDSNNSKLYWFGHYGDGNLHLNTLMGPDINKEEFLKKMREQDKSIFTLVQKYNGSISAEHGIGLLKKEYLSYSKSEDEIRIMTAIKNVFDPKGLLNPGKVYLSKLNGQ